MRYIWQLNNFDSEVFGLKVAKIIEFDPEGSAQTLKRRAEDLIRELVRNKIGYATYRAKFSDLPVIQTLERSGFIIVDGLISLVANTSEVAVGEAAIKTREANKSDLNKLKKLTSGLYLQSRILNDPLISKNKAGQFYRKWIENSLLGKAADSVLVWGEGDEILGYVTLQKKGQIPLLGVSAQVRGKGIAKGLINASFNKFIEWKVESIIVETQIGNIPALRVYQSCGFKIVDSFLTLRWARDD